MVEISVLTMALLVLGVAISVFSVRHRRINSERRQDHKLPGDVTRSPHESRAVAPTDVADRKIDEPKVDYPGSLRASAPTELDVSAQSESPRSETAQEPLLGLQPASKAELESHSTMVPLAKANLKTCASPGSIHIAAWLSGQTWFIGLELNPMPANLSLIRICQQEELELDDRCRRWLLTDPIQPVVFTGLDGCVYLFDRARLLAAGKHAECQRVNRLRAWDDPRNGGALVVEIAQNGTVVLADVILSDDSDLTRMLSKQDTADIEASGHEPGAINAELIDKFICFFGRVPPFNQ